MPDFVIDPNTVSQPEIRADLEEFIASRPDADQWAQFFQSSTGQITIEIMAALAAWLKYDSITARRENYLAYAQTRSGVIAGAQQLGYSINRGRNALIDVTFTPAANATLPKWHVLGSVAGVSLVLLNETVVQAGVPITVQTVVGDILSETIQSDTDSAKTFRFTQKRVSEDVQMLIGTTVVDHSNDVLEMLDDKFFVQSNVLGSVDAKFLNQDSAAVNYSNGTDVTLQWIELKDLSFTESDVAIDEAEGVQTGVTITALFSAAETNDSIRVNAPLENETKFTIRGRNDYAKLLLQADPDFIAAGGRDTAIAAVVEIFALRSDLAIADATEKQALLDSISKNRPFGVQPPIIIDPVPNFLDVDVSLVLEPGAAGDPDATVRGVLAPFEKKLSSPEEIQSIDFEAIEQSLTVTDLIKISRLVIAFTTWSVNSVTRRGKFVEPSTANGFIYEAINFIRYSDSTEPTWPAPTPQTPPLSGFIYGQQVTDGQIVWESIAEDNTLAAWSGDTAYKVGDQVRHTGASGNDPQASFQVVQVLSKSGLSVAGQAASATEQGVTFTADNIGTAGNAISLVFNGSDDIDTVVGAWNLSNPANTVSHDGTGTDVLTSATVNLSNGIDPFDAEPAWPVPASTTEPDSQSFTEDNQILWLMVAKSGTPPTWQGDNTYSIGDVVVPTSVQTGQENVMWQAVAIMGRTGSSEPTFPTAFGGTVIDNEVEWAARNKATGLTVVSPESPNDNEYYLINENVTVS